MIHIQEGCLKSLGTVAVTSLGRTLHCQSNQESGSNVKDLAAIYVLLHSHLAAQDSDDGLGVDQRIVAEVVKAIVGEDLRASLEPDGITELHSVLSKELGGDAAQSAKHGPASMDELQLAVTLEGLWVSRETSSVPAVVTGELTSEVRRGVVLGVWAEVLYTGCAVELNAGG
jgi:hypothetical protein